MTVSSVTTIANLKSLATPSFGDVAEVGGYTTIGDGGGGTFHFDDTLEITAATSASAAITGATNTSPIVITTAAAHGFVTGQSVLVQGVTTNTAANGSWLINVLSGYDLRLMLADAADGLLNEGRKLVIVALVGTELHIRIFDANGKRVVDKAENELISGETLKALKKQLNPLPDESGLSQEQKQKFIRDATSIAGHTLLSSTEVSLLKSRGSGAYTGGASPTVSSVTVTTSGDHGLGAGGCALIERVVGIGEFAIDGSWFPIGTMSLTTFSIPCSTVGSYMSGGQFGDGGVSFPSVAADGRWVRRRDTEFYNVKWFGAIGDGSTDDYGAFAATIAAAGVAITAVYVPGEAFAIGTELSVTTSGQEIRGEAFSYGNSLRGMLKATTSGMRSLFSVEQTQCKISGLFLDCDRKARHGLYLQHAGLLELKQVHVTRAVKDGTYVSGVTDANLHAINDFISCDEYWATDCGTLYRTTGLSETYAGLPVANAIGSVACTANSQTVTGTSTAFKSLGIRPGDFIRIGMDSERQVLEILTVDSDTQLTSAVRTLPTLPLSGQDYAIGVGDGWHEERHNDNNCLRARGGLQRGNAGSGWVCRGLYGPLLYRNQPDVNGFYGIVIGTAMNGNPVFNTQISVPYFEGNGCVAGCIFSASAVGITIDQPMWLGSDTKLRVGFFAENIGWYSDTTGLHPISFITTSDIPTTEGSNVVARGTFTMPSAPLVTIDQAIYSSQVPVKGRNINVLADGTDINFIGTPTVENGVDGQEIAICNIGQHNLTFHDRRGGPDTKLRLDRTPGGTLVLAPGQILELYYSTAHGLANFWTQRGKVV